MTLIRRGKRGQRDLEFFVKAVRGKTKPKLEEKTVFWVLGLVKLLLVMMNKSKTRKRDRDIRNQ
jgi:hypothetical protein